MIISLFGPDGVGKTVAANTLGQELGIPVLNGSKPSTWPDTSWYDSFTREGIYEGGPVDDLMFFNEMITRAHQQAMAIDDEQGSVIVDSDPFHKVFIHDFINGRIAADAMAKHVRGLELFANHDEGREWRHVHLRLSRTGTPIEHATEMQRRIQVRGNVSPYDPATIDASLEMIHASDALYNQLGLAGFSLVDAYSNEPGIL
ncbi:MAG: hypothetical protein JWM52_623 [Candidatus Saccharibacteria bacterium]|nr:hypothetical protein [Candidatus Saccharibacteria bacterium]